MASERRHIALIVFVCGLATLGAEIAAARLLAPWFGASTIVWANTIATVLVALSIGYWVGGRLADRDPTVAGLARVVLIGAALVGAVPFVAGPFLRLSVSALDSVDAGAAVGSLLAVLVLIAAPILVLGCVTPWALRISVDALDSTGRTSGRLSAIGTVGALAGTFTSALVLIPFAGTRRTFLAYALCLALVATPALGRRAAGAVVALALAIAIALPVGTVKAGGGRVLWEAETTYQYARAVQRPDGTRLLELNEGQAVHSLLRADRHVITGGYWDEALTAPASVLGRMPRSVAILGGAAGTVARAYGALAPATSVDLVEIDGELPRVGRRLFALAGPRLRVHITDARPWLHRDGRRFELIYVDAYRQPYIPFYLATREFFELARSRLAPGGVLVINVGHPAASTALERTLSATLRAVFPYVARDPAQRENTQLVAAVAREPSASRLLAATVRMPKQLLPIARATARRLTPSLPGGAVYTDDRAPVEWLVDGSILAVAAGGDR